MSVAIVTTTINTPVLLKDYCANAKQFGHKDVRVIVIGDKKTPTSVTDFCRELQAESGYTVEYYDVPAQLKYLQRWPELRDHLPYNSIQRRNIGMLRAYQIQAEAVITIDDDNFIQGEDDYIGRQAIVGSEQELQVISSNQGWYNVCELLAEEHNLPFYHRGYPLGKRWINHQTAVEAKTGKVVVNAGLWLEAPDIDAITRLTLPINATAYRSTYPNGIALTLNTWSPFNSQNTALAREVIPAYFLSPAIGRYDDIWASYIVKKISDHLGHYIQFGPPIVRQMRNPHNYFKDFDQERLGMELTDRFIEVLPAAALQGADYAQCFAEIHTHLTAVQMKVLEGTQDRFTPAFGSMLDGMRIWHEALANV